MTLLFKIQKTLVTFSLTVMLKVRVICRANQWTGFYMITASVMKELILYINVFFLIIKYPGEGENTSFR